MRISDWSSDVCSSDLLVAGDSMAKGVSATAYGDNIALEAGAVSGDDTITAGAGRDSISGGALASAVNAALADQHNQAEGDGSAGNDVIDAEDRTSTRLNSSQ